MGAYLLALNNMLVCFTNLGCSLSVGFPLKTKTSAFELQFRKEQDSRASSTNVLKSKDATNNRGKYIPMIILLPTTALLVSPSSEMRIKF